MSRQPTRTPGVAQSRWRTRRPTLSRLAGGAGGLAAGWFDDDAEVAEFLVAALEQVLDLGALEVAQGLGDVLLEAVGGGVGVAVGAAERLGDDRVDHAELAEVAAGELEALGELRGAFISLEQDGAARLGGNHRIPGKFHHGDPVGDADAERA